MTTFDATRALELADICDPTSPIDHELVAQLRAAVAEVERLTKLEDLVHGQLIRERGECERLRNVSRALGQANMDLRDELRLARAVVEASRTVKLSLNYASASWAIDKMHEAVAAYDTHVTHADEGGPE